MEKIFQKDNCVILSFIVQWILGFGCKTPEKIKILLIIQLILLVIVE